MAKRSEVVRPDSVIETLDGQQILVASREALIAAAIRAVETMLLAGGEFTMSSQRAPTGFQDESVCVAALVQWRSHSARTTRPDPEPHVEPTVYTPEERAIAEDMDLPLPDEDAEPLEDDVDAAIPTAVG